MGQRPCDPDRREQPKTWQYFFGIFFGIHLRLRESEGGSRGECVGKRRRESTRAQEYRRYSNEQLYPFDTRHFCKFHNNKATDKLI